MRRMNKFRISILNIFCALALILTAFFSWQYLTVGTTYILSDYSTFYRTIHTKDPMYDKYYYVYIHSSDFDFKTVPAKHSGLREAINLNTPIMNLFLKGLLNISNKLWINTLCWTAISLIFSLISICFLMNYFIDNKEISYHYFLPLTAMLWLSWPSIYAQIGGQVSYLILPFLSLAFLLGYLKKSIPMVLVLSFVASLKIFFMIFLLWFLIRREWKLSIIFIAAFIFYFFIPLAFFSWHDYREFFQLAEYQQLFIIRSAFSMNGALLEFLTNTLHLFKINLSAKQLNLTAGVLSCYIIFRYIVYYYRYLRDLTAYLYELSFSFTIVLALILSPLAWVYYYVFLLIPAVTLLKINQKHYFSKTLLFFFMMALYLPILAWIPPTHFLLYFVRDFSAFFDLLCWLACLHLASRTIISEKIATSENQKIPYLFLIINIVLGITLLSINYGFSYYLTVSKKDYIKNIDAGIWVNIKKKT